jgi:hypothetical protein
MKKSQLKEIIRGIIYEELALENSASDEAKRQGLEYMSFGRWGKDGKVTHRSVKGKLQPVKAGSSEPAQEPKQQSSLDYLKNAPTAPKSGLMVKKGTSPAGLKLVDKVQEKFDAAFEAGKLSDADYNRDIPIAEFEKLTGITKKAAKFYTDTLDDWEIGFTYDADTDSVFVNDPMDV